MHALDSESSTTKIVLRPFSSPESEAWIWPTRQRLAIQSTLTIAVHVCWGSVIEEGPRHCCTIIECPICRKLVSRKIILFDWYLMFVFLLYYAEMTITSDSDKVHARSYVWSVCLSLSSSSALKWPDHNLQVPELWFERRLKLQKKTGVTVLGIHDTGDNCQISSCVL